MTGLAAEILRQLGQGRAVADVCAGAGMTRARFDARWQEELRRRLPLLSGARPSPIGGRAEITRDRWGVAHITANSDADLFFALGYAVAQDRLFQLDWYRRRALGQVSEILGPSGLADDTVARVVGLNRIAAAQAKALPAESRHLVEAYAWGINAHLEAAQAALPIEFALLDYKPRPWTVEDSVAVALEFSYYLTVRFPVIVLPEMAKRHLKDATLVDAYLFGEMGDETIVPRGAYPAAPAPVRPVSHTAGDPDSGVGSNNWVVDGSLAEAGKPLLASDPHIAFRTTSHWYEVHLKGGSFDVGGVHFVGFPGFLIGRNARVAWGLTNNAGSSQRDLYQERTDPSHPGCFLFDGMWEKARKVTETIQVRGAAPVVKTVLYSRNGPIVDELLGIGAKTGPISLKWLGDCLASWIPPVLDMNRADSVDAFRASLKPWVCPSNCLVIADVEGNIGYHCTGNIPLRRTAERGYRAGWDPGQQWIGTTPWEGMPQLKNPPRGWIATANNPTAPPDFPYPLSGTWASDERARRCREMLEGRPSFDIEAFKDMQHDTLSLRARRAAPMLASLLGRHSDPLIGEAARHFVGWNHRISVDSVPALLFEVFTRHWNLRVARERFPADLAPTMAGAIFGLGMQLLHEDQWGWFGPGGRDAALAETMRTVIDDLGRRLGPDMAEWRYSRLHVLRLKHYLAGHGELGLLLDRLGPPTGGSAITVCNSHFDDNYESDGGATCRFIADMSSAPPAFWNVLPQGQSGNQGSPHYCDQSAAWVNRVYHRVGFEGPDASQGGIDRLILEPERIGSALAAGGDE
ncbi:MAG: penicillin acylase family protein [Proteobacteria bacterium]|nr:penicillin acylase family protein [Pseudomonadota bacterium]MBI3500094.1 penicillin acylase family protein [Pseudomonadota bacterium]